MRVLHLADTHLGQHLPVWGAPQGWHRSQDHEAQLLRALQPALRDEADLVVHAGDLFDRRRPSPAVVRRALEILGAVARRVPVVLIPGNHDPPSLRRVFRLPVPGLHVIDQPARLRFGELALAAVPYCRGVEAWRRWAQQAAKTSADALVLHQAVHLARLPRFTFRTGRPAGTLPPQALPAASAIMAGHIHPRQEVRLGERAVVYAGSTERTSFSEGSQAKGYVLWELGRRWRWRFVDLPSRPMLLVRSAQDLGAAPRQALVRIAHGPQYRDLYHLALEKGLWIVGRRPGDPLRGRSHEQLRLFPRP